MKNLIISFITILFSFSSFAFIGPIIGPSSICVGSTAFIDDTTYGGTWSCSSSHLSIDPTLPKITGISAGAAIITYTIGMSFVTLSVTVYPTPAYLGEDSTVCQGSTLALSETISGGIWNDTLALPTYVLSVDSLTGVVTGISSGTQTVTYTLPTGCFAITAISVYEIAPISGGTSVCYGDTLELTDTVSGGGWSSSFPSVAIVGISGEVLTYSSGITTISYATSHGCAATKTVTVLPTPSIIMGAGSLCSGSTSTLFDAISGGIWTSGNPLVASIGSTSGLVSAITSGTSILTYTLGSGCSRTKALSVGGIPSTVYSVTGGGSYCAGGIGINIGLTGSTSLLEYGLYIGSTLVGTALGTGTAISFGPQTASGVYNVIATPTLPCTTLMSDSATISIMPVLIPSDFITVSPGDTVCAGTTVTITASIINGGSSPGYSWIWDSYPVSYDSIISYIPSSGDSIHLELTSTELCASPAVVSSNTIIMHVITPPLTASASTASCGGIITITATGASTYSWSPTTGLTCSTCSTTTLFPLSGTSFTLTGTDSLGCSDTATIAVDGNRIYGHISYTGLSTDTLNVWLIQFNPADSSIAAIDSQYTCTDSGTPYFEFDDMPTGNYMVKAVLLGTIPGTSGYVPTYSLSSPHWDSAVTIAHGSSADAMNITMVYGTVPSGPGFIAGYVYAGAGKATSGDAQVQGMLIYLQDALGNTITSAITDGTGAYSFSNIAEGSYYVYPEKYKYYTTTSALITLSSGSDTVTSVNFKQHTTFGTITPYDFTKVPQPVINTTGLSIYPNPTTGNLNIQWTNQTSSNAIISVSDMTGREVYSTSYMMNTASGKTEIDLGSLENGMYLIDIKSDKVLYSGKLVRISN